MNYQLTNEALKKLGNLFVSSMKKKIAAKIYPYGNPKKSLGNKIASGKLYESLSYKVEMFNGQPVLAITYADYFKYVNLGRRANVKRVPLDVLFKWIKIRGIRGRDKKGRFIKDMSLAWAIQTNIFKYGIRPANIYDKTIDNLEDLFDNPPPEMARELETLYDAIAGDINNLIENMIELEIKKI